MIMKRIMFISDHASPIASPGSTDCGGQNVYVAEVAASLISMGYCVDVFTRKDNDKLDEIVECGNGMRVIHVEAGPPEYIPKEDLLPYMNAFSAYVRSFMVRNQVHYDLIHAHFFMSGIVAAKIKESCGVPFGITFHAL